jgi:hypothetical protein
MADKRRHAASSDATAALECLECGAVADEFAPGWRAYVGGAFADDDAAVVIGIYCPACSQREFEGE